MSPERGTVLERKPLLGSLGFGLCERGNVVPAIGSSDDGAEGHHKQVVEWVAFYGIS